MKRVPDGAQNCWEWLVEGLYKFLEACWDGISSTGPSVFASIFIFISRRTGRLIPVGAIGWGIDRAARGGAALRHHADVNLALAWRSSLRDVDCLGFRVGPVGFAARTVRAQGRNT
jgi:hypothetical protein